MLKRSNATFIKKWPTAAPTKEKEELSDESTEDEDMSDDEADELLDGLIAKVDALIAKVEALLTKSFASGGPVQQLVHSITGMEIPHVSQVMPAPR